MNINGLKLTLRSAVISADSGAPAPAAATPQLPLPQRPGLTVNNALIYI